MFMLCHTYAALSYGEEMEDLAITITTTTSLASPIKA